ncbi:SRPBCC domain-containing protein [Bowmanella sp. Y26]|uniref:SRPBCC domain-containing protein n=1 Tax=Bowmanella yangjiangensis TaxID=2811230 RepID=A0ABS3CV96_9ALTE|nr:SRPBCC domain-containing protein [Bowmanella yangjiangensis]MBN7821037.1 SRPBCC domain-containing protein [Bowmanella yangjiangensis]MBT1062012.1 SRPBCC domain-containing protein [Bowmanella yangjiangensis]
MDPIIVKRVFPCAKRQLFDAWSKPALMMKWFFKGQQPNAPSTVNNSFTLGGEYEVIMHLPSGDYRHYGTYSAIHRYHHIAFSWNSHLVQNSRVSLDFKALSPNRTELTLTHHQFPNEEVRGKHNEGWQGCLDNLERLATQLVSTK